MAEIKEGIPQVCEAVTFAAALLARLRNAGRLDERDRQACATAYERLLIAEGTLYGRRNVPSEVPQ